MGRKKIKATLVAVLAIFAGYNVYSSQQFEVISEIGLANVEALAESEGDWDPNVAYGYAMATCKDDKGFITGQRCERSIYSVECNLKHQYGNCR